jgi:hypothetical protein
MSSSNAAAQSKSPRRRPLCRLPGAVVQLGQFKLQRSVMSHALHLLINLLSVYVVIAPQKVARNRQSRRHLCVSVDSLVRYLERHEQSKDDPNPDPDPPHLR